MSSGKDMQVPTGHAQDQNSTIKRRRAASLLTLLVSCTFLDAEERCPPSGTAHVIRVG